MGMEKPPSPHKSSESKASSQVPTRNRTRLLVFCVFAAVAVALLPVLVGLVLPAIQFSFESSRRTSCSNNLGEIGFALEQYRREKGHFPPAYTVDEKGQPLHSWRALILPYINQKELHDKIDFSKPWDDPVNRAATETVVSTYSCPSSDLESTQTTYVAVVDPRGIMTGSEPTTSREVLDGVSTTIALVETDSGNAVYWMSPQDIDFQAFINMGTVREFGGHMGGSHELMADGAVIFTTDSIEPGLHELLLTKAGGERIEEYLGFHD